MGRAADTSRRRLVVSALAGTGIAGPIVFSASAAVHSILRPDHNLVTDPISALAAGPSGWVQNVSFFVFGLLMISYAIGLHLGVASTRSGALGLMFLVLSGLGLVWASLFPATDAAGAFQKARSLHIPGFVLTFFGAGTGLIVMSRRMKRDPSWHNIASYAQATGVIVLVLLLMGAVLVRPAGAPLHPRWGLFQWVLLAVWCPCTVVVARRLLQVSRDAGVRAAAGGVK